MRYAGYRSISLLRSRAGSQRYAIEAPDLVFSALWNNALTLRLFCTAVTLDGTIIHKSGMMTGGTTLQNQTRHFEEREVEGE